MSVLDAAARRRALLGANAAERAFGTEMLGEDVGTVTASTTPPVGRTGAAWLGPLADVLLARAAMTTTTRLASCRTVGLRMDLVGSVAGGTMIGEGRTVAVDRGLALSEAEIRGRDGELVARCTGRLRLAPIAPEDALFSGDATNDLATMPMFDLLGLESAARDATSATLRVHGSDLVGNQYGAMHGGAQVALALEAAEWFVADDADTWRALDTSVSFLAAVPAVASPPLALTLELQSRTRNLVRFGVRLATADLDNTYFTALTSLARSEPSTLDALG